MQVITVAQRVQASETIYTATTLKKAKKHQLQQIANSKGLSTRGNKQNLIDAILEAQKEHKALISMIDPMFGGKKTKFTEGTIEVEEDYSSFFS